MTRFLDIHIIYCDKDVQYLDELVQRCKDFKIMNAKYEWQINVFTHDNTGKNNIGQFQRRLEIIKDIPSDHYIWFIDGDDEISSCIDLMSADGVDLDMYIFGHQIYETFIKGERLLTNVKPLEMDVIFDATDPKNTFRCEYMKNIELGVIAGGSLWNKWVRGSCWKGVYDFLKENNCENIRPNSSEDVFFSFYALDRVKYIFVTKNPIYFYHNERSKVFDDNKLLSYETFKAFRADHAEVSKLVFNFNVCKSGWFERNDTVCHLQKALQCKETKKALDDLIDEYGCEKLLKSLILHFNVFLPHPYMKYLAAKYINSKS